MQAISTQWIKAYSVIPALAGIQDGCYFWIPPRAGMTGSKDLTEMPAILCNVRVNKSRMALKGISKTLILKFSG